MYTPEPTSDSADSGPQLILRLELRLRHHGADSGWTGEVTAPDVPGRLRFPSLPALIAWIARLEPQPPSRGIR